MIAPKKERTLIIGTIMNKEYINKIAWIKIQIFLKSIKNIYLGNEKNCKRFMESIYWMARTDAQWRELPSFYGNWNSVFKRFNSWSKKNIWNDFLQYCIQDPDLECVMIDATIIRAHACAAGYSNQKTEGLRRSAGGFSSKIHAKVDALGNPLQFIVTPGQQSDITQADRLLQGVNNAYVLGDKGYHSKILRDMLKKNNCIPVIPSRSNSIEQYEYDKYMYKERHLIECFFSKIKQFRRVFSRFDKSLRNFLAFLSFVGACIWLR